MDDGNIFQRLANKLKGSKKKKKPVEKDEQSTVYVIASSVLLSGMLVAATIFYFGMQIMDGINDIKYPYDPDNPTSDGSLMYYARQEGLSLSKFEACLEGDKYNEDVDNDMSDAEDLGLSGTPAFYIGEYASDTTMRGFIIPGAYPYETFDTAINSIKANGLDGAFEEMTDEIRDPLYQSRYEQILQYYEGDGSMTTAEAKKLAKTEAAAYADEKWQIQEIGLGTIPPKKEGDPNIVIVEFTDYNCPYCKRHVTETLPEIQENYISNGIVAYYMRDLPLEELSGHENSYRAARAARCAGDQGKYWEFHDWVFGAKK